MGGYKGMSSIIEFTDPSEKINRAEKTIYYSFDFMQNSLHGSHFYTSTTSKRDFPLLRKIQQDVEATADEQLAQPLLQPRQCSSSTEPVSSELEEVLSTTELSSFRRIGTTTLIELGILFTLQACRAGNCCLLSQQRFIPLHPDLPRPSWQPRAGRLRPRKPRNPNFRIWAHGN
ncbi:hypothetical protein AAG906_001948 [Vitis piasezkii]